MATIPTTTPSSPPPPSPLTSQEMDDFLTSPRFNHTFILDPSSTNGLSAPFSLKYADYGDTSSPHVLLFFGPLMGYRLIHSPKDNLAKRHGIRIIDTDRPGIGGTDPLPAGVGVEGRMKLWRAALPPLLQHLNITHLSCIASHSGGTIYALDFVLHHPTLLHPQCYLALAAPWILPKHTSSSLLSFVSILPRGMIGNFDGLANLIGNHVGPAVGKMIPASFSSSSTSATGSEGNEDLKFEQRIWDKLIKKMYEEGVSGAGEDAVLFMQKAEGEGSRGWGDWGDYDVLIPRLVEGLKREGKKLRVDVFYAEKDHMIGAAGTKGPVWLDGCWKGKGEEYGDVLEFGSRVVKGADHDSIWSLKWDVVREVLGKLGKRREEEDSGGLS